MQDHQTRFLFKSQGIFIQPKIVKYVGGRVCAHLLQQIHYFLTSKYKTGVVHKEKKWIYNTIESWSNILGYSASSIKNSISYLKKQGIIIIEKLSKNKSNRTNFYTIDYQQLYNLLGQYLNLEELKIETSNTTSTPYKKEEKNINNESKNNQSIAKNCPMVIQENTNKKLIQSNKSDESKNNFSTKMLKIWNDIIKPNKLVELSKKRCQFMIAALKRIFNGDIKKWQQYCHFIASSDFLMGKIKSTFQIHFDWALKFETIQKIFEGQYGVKLNDGLKTNNNTEKINNDTLNSIISEHSELNIQESFKEISKKITFVQFKSWFENIKVEKIENNTVFLNTKNKLYSDFIKRTFNSEILFSFNKFNPNIKRIEIGYDSMCVKNKI